MPEEIKPVVITKEPVPVLFDTPKVREDLIGVVADEGTTLRFGYKVLPDGSGCLHRAMKDIPESVMTWLLGEAKKNEE